MTIGASILLIAVGAILRYAIVDNIDNVDLAIVGLILMVCGGIGLVIGVVQIAGGRGGPPRY